MNKKVNIKTDKMDPRSRRYSDRDKLRLLEEFKESDLSIAQFQENYGMGHSTLSKWMTKFGLSFDKKEVLMATIEEKNTPGNKKSTQERILEARIRQLEQELNDEKIKSLAYKTMIEIAEEELGVDITKKAGARR